MHTRGSQRIGAERNARQAQREIDDVEGKQRHQADECYETPALGLDALDQLLEPAARLLCHPVAGDVARDQEGQHRPQRGAGEGIQRAGDDAEQRAGSQRQDRAGKE
jgi:hypothetical protein